MPLSIVIPAYNEEGNIGRLITETFESVPDDMVGEVIVVDDASRDGTVAEIAALQNKFSKLRLLSHVTNGGQSACLRSGIDAARFDCRIQVGLRRWLAD